MSLPSKPKLAAAVSRLAVCAGLLILATPANADPFSVLDQLGPPVEDNELSDMRGRFVTPQAVSFFGISMTTSWLDANGITTVAHLVFNVDFLNLTNDGEPAVRLMLGWVRDGDPAMDVTDTNEGYVPLTSPDSAGPIGALGTFQGAAQANIIAGADNTAVNGMQMMIVPASQIPELSASGLSPTANIASIIFADGDELLFRAADNEVGIVLTGNEGLDSSLQIVGGDVGQALQQTMLNSDGNSVFNNTTILFGTNPLGNLQQVQAQEALSVMHGFGF